MSSNEWYFTAPWDPVSIRRGDALGLRAGADYFADLLAPGLSNSTTDARWISILSWCLNWSHVAWQKAGGCDLSRRDDQRERYLWLRPLELLWIDRALVDKKTTGQLRGRDSISRWQKSGRQETNFSMSQDQLRRYRQIGMYGAYRVIFRTIPGLTTGDGWTPGTTALGLADIVNNSLPREVQLSQGLFEDRTQWAHWSNGNEADYWIKRGWNTWNTKPAKGKLPTKNEDLAKRIDDKKERELLEKALFSEDSVRRVVAVVLANANNPETHLDLCKALAESPELSKIIAPELLKLLPVFSDLADTAMQAMRRIWSKINQNDQTPTPTIQELAKSVDLTQLMKASAAWLNMSDRDHFPHKQVATQLAQVICDAKTPVERLSALAKHHQECGGGRRWFQVQGDKLVPLVANTGITASDYRFRLWPLCLLAAQCGVAKMDQALSAMSQETNEEEDE